LIDHSAARQSRLEAGPPESGLTSMLHFVRMKSVFYTRSQLTAPWGLEIPPLSQTLMFHLLVSGECQLTIGDCCHRLHPGEFVLLPHGRGHTLRSDQLSVTVPLFDLPLQSVSEHYEVLETGGGGASSILLCGAVAFNDPLMQRLLDQMPALVTVDRDESEASVLLQQTLQLLASEARNNAAGASNIINRLADVLIIQAVRVWLGQQGQPQGWVAAWQDNQLGKVLRLMHLHPERQWTLARLAGEGAMSRTRFTELFRSLTGATPMGYLTELRMALAIDQLRYSPRSILDIALSVGYQSESAFSRAFRRATGTTPRAVRVSSPAQL